MRSTAPKNDRREKRQSDRPERGSGVMRTADRRRLETERGYKAETEHERRGLAQSMIDALEDILRWERSQKAS
jgi:hypothetical protein